MTKTFSLFSHCRAIATVMLLWLGLSTLAFASGTGDDWGLNNMIDTLLNFLRGSGGKLMGLVGFMIAIYFATFQLDLKPAGIWFGVAVVILGAPNIINTVFSALI